MGKLQDFDEKKTFEKKKNNNLKIDVMVMMMMSQH